MDRYVDYCYLLSTPLLTRNNISLKNGFLYLINTTDATFQILTFWK